MVMDSRTIGIPLSDPEGYKLTVSNAVRITSGGVYVHSAPWSVGSQGYANVSHGCINLARTMPLGTSTPSGWAIRSSCRRRSRYWLPGSESRRSR